MRQAELSAVTGSPDLSATRGRLARRGRRRRDEDGVEIEEGERGDAFGRLYEEAVRQRERHEAMRKQAKRASQPDFRPRLVAGSVRAKLQVGRVSSSDGGTLSTPARGRQSDASPAETFDRLYTDAQRLSAAKELMRREKEEKAVTELKSSPLVSEPEARRRWRERLSSRSRSRVSRMLHQLEQAQPSPSKAVPLPSSPDDGTASSGPTSGIATPSRQSVDGAVPEPALAAEASPSP